MLRATAIRSSTAASFYHFKNSLEGQYGRLGSATAPSARHWMFVECAIADWRVRVTDGSRSRESTISSQSRFGVGRTRLVRMDASQISCVQYRMCRSKRRSEAARKKTPLVVSQRVTPIPGIRTVKRAASAIDRSNPFNKWWRPVTAFLFLTTSTGE